MERTDKQSRATWKRFSVVGPAEHPEFIMTGAVANKRQPDANYPAVLSTSTSAPPLISGQRNEPAAPRAAEMAVEEANSSRPGVHIVAPLQWDRLRQISSRRLEGGI